MLLNNYEIILFTMRECYACEKFKPIFEEVVKDKYKYIILNVDDNKEYLDLALLLDITGFPTFITIKQNNIKKYIGCISKNKLVEIFKNEFNK